MDMRRSLGAIAALVTLLATPVLAADMALKAPPPAASPAGSWAGFYAGINGGVGWNDPTGDRYCVSPAGVLFGAGCNPNIAGHVVAPHGALFGGTAGYNFQSGRLLVGLETDLQWSGMKASASDAIASIAPGVYTATDNLNWFGTTRARIGLLATSDLLVYGTAGLIYGHDSVTSLVSFPGGGAAYPGSASATRGGGVGGAGIEYAFARNFSAKIEGLYYDMGTLTTSGCNVNGGAPCAGGFTQGGNFKIRGEMLRAGLNWHLGGPLTATN